MPRVNILVTDEAWENAQGVEEKDKLVDSLQELIAKQLSCSERKLNTEDIDIYLIRRKGNYAIAPIVIEITAHNYAERMERSDNIAKKIKSFFAEHLAQAGEAKVLLHLMHIGYSG